MKIKKKKRAKENKNPADISASARESILARLNNARSTTDYPLLSDIDDKGGFVFPEPDDLLKVFADELTEVNGTLITAANEKDAASKLQALLSEKDIKSLYCVDKYLLNTLNKSVSLENRKEKFEEMEAAVTRCETLVARSGTVVVSSAGSGRRLNVFPPVHIVWAFKKQLVPFISDAMTLLKKKYGSELPSQITFVTGPSRTADIEKTLVLGAHGPRELVVFLIKQ